MRKASFYTAVASTAVIVVLIMALVGVIRLPLPGEDGSDTLPGLAAPVRVDFDALGIPRISADKRADAVAAFGYVTARDRLFQMDLLRRAPAGRLAEIFGAGLVKEDSWNRTMGFDRLAKIIFTRLPQEQKDALASYSAGVNKIVNETSFLPMEFTFLGYRPEPWRPEDSVLVLLAMSASYSYNGRQEREADVMRQALPPEVVTFLTPESDCYNEILAPRNPARCASDEAPYEELEKLVRETAGKRTAGLVSQPEAPHGSNGWVVGRAKTRDGRAIMANDMHLSLSVPNIWYRAELNYESVRLTGMTIPGLPMIVTGSNGELAWGFTSVEGDFSDLVKIEKDAADPTHYLTAEGKRRFDTRMERIEVRGAAAVVLEVKETIWGPVSPEAILGDEVAVHWTGLDPVATNFDLMDMDHATTLQSALSLFHRAGGPPLNVLLASRAGQIAWTLMAKLPRRVGFDGLFSESWADGKRGWDGYVPPEETPTIVDPPSGFLVNANQRMLGAAEFEPKIGHDFTGGYRAWRVSEILRGLSGIGESDMLSLQLDTTTIYYKYYQSLALRVLAEADEGERQSHDVIRRYLEAWDGRAEAESLGLPLILEFRRSLMDAIFSPILARCRELDPTFVYWWSGADAPLQRIIESRRPGLLPGQKSDGDWSSFVRALLLQSSQRLTDAHKMESIAGLSWGMVNRVDVRHPLAEGAPFLAGVLDMPSLPLAGCVHCVRFASGRNGASARMIVAPGHEEDGILHMPTGQSGQFGSSHYADQQADWVSGRAIPFRAEQARHLLLLKPRDAKIRIDPLARSGGGESSK